MLVILNIGKNLLLYLGLNFNVELLALQLSQQTICRKFNNWCILWLFCFDFLDWENVLFFS
jgi:hypothetical protein